jgi:hypothetical protein
VGLCESYVADAVNSRFAVGRVRTSKIDTFSQIAHTSRVYVIQTATKTLLFHLVDVLAHKYNMLHMNIMWHNLKSSTSFYVTQFKLYQHQVGKFNRMFYIFFSFVHEHTRTDREGGRLHFPLVTIQVW